MKMIKELQSRIAPNEYAYGILGFIIRAHQLLK